MKYGKFSFCIYLSVDSVVIASVFVLLCRTPLIRMGNVQHDVIVVTIHVAWRCAMFIDQHYTCTLYTHALHVVFVYFTIHTNENHNPFKLFPWLLYCEIELCW